MKNKIIRKILSYAKGSLIEEIALPI